MCTKIVVAFLMDFLAQTWVAAYLYTQSRPKVLAF